MSRFECSIKRCHFGTHSPLGMTAHARTHRNEFERLVGRPPKDYDAVRRLFNTGWTPEDFDGDHGQPTRLTQFNGGAEQ